MAVQPVVRYMILCEDWGAQPTHPHRINVYGLLNSIRSLDDPAYPLLYRELCVLLFLTGGRGSGTVQIFAVFEETGDTVFATPQRSVDLGVDPLRVVGLPFRIRDCLFPNAGRYEFQFWYNDKQVETRPLLLR